MSSPVTAAAIHNPGEEFRGSIACAFDHALEVESSPVVTAPVGEHT
jgi:hypothetical protein